MPFCNKCGTEVPENVNFCQKCGNALQIWQNSDHSSNTIVNRDIEFDTNETRKMNFRRIVEGCALLLCVLFFVCPLVKCTQDSSLTASGWEIATGTGNLFDKKSENGYPLVFALIILPAVLMVRAFMDKPFIALCNVSIAGLAAKILFIIGVYVKINSGDSKHLFELTGYNWFIVFIYGVLVGITRYCMEQDKNVKILAPVEKSSFIMDSFTDPRDNKTYKTVKIGTQTWMAENLCYDAEGSKIYGNDPVNLVYGRLYDWETAKKACPAGWHLPTKAEWDILITAVGGKKTAGKYLKAASGWNSNGNGEDAFSFVALPGGKYSSDGFYGIGNNGYWWSASEYSINDAYYMPIYCDYEGTDWSYNSERFLFSVRCLKD